MRGSRIFTGSSNPLLAKLVTDRLASALSPLKLKKPGNTETTIEIGVSVRNHDVFIIQSGCAPVNDHLMEALVLINACKFASAKRITAVIPYFPYSKQSKKKSGRAPITAKMVANMLQVAGVDRVITMDLHATQIQGFFDVPVDNLLSEPTMIKYIMSKVADYRDGVVVAKNAGAAKRVTSFADRLQIDFAIIHRELPMEEEEFYPGKKQSSIPDRKGNLLKIACDATSSHASTPDVERSSLTVVGDVNGKVAFILDDIIDKCSSFLEAADELIRLGARRVYILACHGVLSGDSLERIEADPNITELIISNSIPIATDRSSKCKKLSIIDISLPLAEGIRRVHNGESISYLFHSAQ